MTIWLQVPSQYNSPVQLVKKAQGVWKLMEDNCQRHSAFASAVLAIPDIVTVTQSIAHYGIWHAVLDFGHVFFLIPLASEDHDPGSDSAFKT